jgi:hypothetical protein
MMRGSAPPADLILHRLAVIELRPPPGQTASISVNYADVVVQTLASKQVPGGIKVVVAGGVPLERRPKLTQDLLVVVPDRPRRRSVLGIEAIADLVSITERCSRVISSPFPWVAFEPTGDAGRAWLSEAAGIHELDRIVDIPSTSPRVEMSPDIIDGLRDRSGGVVLLAEALAQRHPTGQFRDFFRVFEHAFALPARLLVAPLQAFLDDRYGYTGDELEQWRDLRDAATHADVRKKFVLEADVRPVLARVKQAAYDVLLNKKTWRNPSPARRDLWSPNGWTSQPSGEVKMLQHSTGTLEAQLLDQFGASRPISRACSPRSRQRGGRPLSSRGLPSGRSRSFRSSLRPSQRTRPSPAAFGRHSKYPHELERRRFALGGDDLEAVVRELLGQEAPYPLLVLHQQHPFPTAAKRPARSRHGQMSFPTKMLRPTQPCGSR